MAGEAELLTRLYQSVLVIGSVRIVAAHAISGSNRLMNDGFDEISGDFRMAIDTQGRADSRDEMFAACRMRRVAFQTLGVLCRRMHPIPLLIFIGEIGVAGNAEIEAVRNQRRLRSRLL